MCRVMINRVFGHIRPAKTPVSLRIQHLIRAFTLHLQSHCVLQNVWMESKGPDYTLRMFSVIWIRTFCTYPKTFFFRSTKPIYVWLYPVYPITILYFNTTGHVLMYFRYCTTVANTLTSIREWPFDFYWGGGGWSSQIFLKKKKKKKSRTHFCPKKKKKKTIRVNAMIPFEKREYKDRNRWKSDVEQVSRNKKHYQAANISPSTLPTPWLKIKLKIKLISGFTGKETSLPRVTDLLLLLGFLLLLINLNSFLWNSCWKICKRLRISLGSGGGRGVGVGEGERGWVVFWCWYLYIF